MMWSPEDQKVLADLMNQDPAAAEKAFRQLAETLATQYFGIVASPQPPQEMGELTPLTISLFSVHAVEPVPPARVLRLQHAARAEFYERLRFLIATADSGGEHASH